MAAAGLRWGEEGANLLQPDTLAEGDTTGEAFLRAATRLVNEQGYPGASVDAISAALKLTKGSFYHHHETKEDLITACFERTFAVTRSIQRAAALAPGNGWQRLVLACRAFVRFQMSERGPLLYATACDSLPPNLQGKMLQSMGQLNERFATLILDGMGDGSIRVLDPATAAHLVSGMINAAPELSRWAPGATPANAGSLYARPMLEGLLTD